MSQPAPRITDQEPTVDESHDPSDVNPWWLDLADGSRTHCISEGGFPRDLTGVKFQSLQNPKLHYPVMTYRHQSGDLFIYGRGRLVGKKSYFARVDALTLEIKQWVELPFSAYIGGGLLHPNGHAYLVHGRTIYRFEDSDLEKMTQIDMPRVKTAFTAINGLGLAPDGRILAKGWGMDMRDFSALEPSAKWIAKRLGFLAAVWAGAATVMPSGLLPIWLGLGAVGFAIPASIFARLLPNSGKGWMAVVDENDLSILQCDEPPERLAYGRLTVVEDKGTTWIVAVGTTRVYRWSYEGGRLTLDTSWEHGYRTDGDGSSIACAATACGGSVYLTDNAQPAGIDKPGMRLHAIPLDAGEPVRGVLDIPGPGLNFWCSAASEAAGSVIVYDVFCGRLEARSLADLSTQWGADVRCTDAVAISDGSGHVYASDWKSSLPMDQWGAVLGPTPIGEGVDKDLVVLDLKTGDELARIPLGQTAPTMSAIVPGANNDVFVPMRGGMIRVAAV